MNKVKHFPVECPSCQDHLDVTKLRCPGCETEVSGTYPLPQLGLLNTEDQEFIVKFVLASGSLKEMAKQLGVSYPTVRNRVNSIIKAIESQNA